MNKKKVTLYRDKVTGVGKGDGTVTYQDPEASQAAVDWFNGDSPFYTLYSILSILLIFSILYSYSVADLQAKTSEGV